MECFSLHKIMQLVLPKTPPCTKLPYLSKEQHTFGLGIICMIKHTTLFLLLLRPVKKIR